MTDEEHWTNFYKTFQEQKQSSFADFCFQYVQDLKGKILVDLGCGNGRDSKFFAEKGFRVVAIDQIENFETYKNVNYCKINFKNLPQYDGVGVIYSRFSLHAIEEYIEDLIIKWSYNSLLKSGYFCIEARTINDEKFGKGQKISDKEYILDGHYRRFLNIETIKQKLLDHNFEIVYGGQSRGWSIYNHEDPILLRIICKKGSCNENRI